MTLMNQNIPVLCLLLMLIPAATPGFSSDWVSVSTCETAQKSAPCHSKTIYFESGTFDSADSFANTITIKDKSDKPKTFNLAPKVVIKKGKMRLNLDDIHNGDRVTLYFKKEKNELIVASIKISLPKKTKLFHPLLKSDLIKKEMK